MSNVDAAIVFLPRFTTLVCGSGTATFTTQPLDCSRYGSAQFQIWGGGPVTPPAALRVFLEESLDAENWVLGPSTPTGFELTTDHPKLFSYSFRLRWFRLRFELTDIVAMTCWAEGLLRDGGGGAWAPPPRPAGTGPTIGPPVSPPGPGRSPDGRAGGNASPFDNIPSAVKH